MKTICIKLPFFGNFPPVSALRPRFQPVGNIDVYDSRFLAALRGKRLEHGAMYHICSSIVFILLVK
jgi:hypothetical protein